MKSKTALVKSADVVAVSSVPVGTVLPYMGDTPPNGYLLCDGSKIDGNDYPDLQKLIGDHLPDLRSRFLVGAGQGDDRDKYKIGDTGGDESIQLSVDELPKHSHTINDGDFGYHSGSFKGNTGKDLPFETNASKPLKGTDDVGDDKAHENRPPYYALNYVIKY
ncbi:MAG: tail fiber protein [Bacteroidota bacterium]